MSRAVLVLALLGSVLLNVAALYAILDDLAAETTVAGQLALLGVLVLIDAFLLFCCVKPSEVAREFRRVASVLDDAF